MGERLDRKGLDSCSTIDVADQRLKTSLSSSDENGVVGSDVVMPNISSDKTTAESELQSSSTAYSSKACIPELSDKGGADDDVFLRESKLNSCLRAAAIPAERAV